MKIAINREQNPNLFEILSSVSNLREAKKVINIFALSFTLLGTIFVSCEDNYDPIGNNKPMPVLKVDSKFVAAPGTGGSFPVSVTTNAEVVEATSTASWISGTFSNSVVSLTAAANPEDAVREAYAKIATVTGQNEAQVALRVIQAGSGMAITANMLRSELDSDWKTIRLNGNWTIEDNSLRTDSPGDVMSVMVCQKDNAKTVRSATRKFRFSVDVKNNNSWAGVVFHAKDGQNFFYIGLNINPTSLFVIVDRIYNGGGSPMAMDPGIVLSADRDPFLRCEIVTTTEKPNEFTLNVYELKTTGDVSLNTDQSVVQKLVYTRAFNNNLLADGGYAGVWGKVGGGYFRRFVLTTN
ncbi:MAG: BACON domain-containing protein [Prolixibacteraceae bacterium]